MLVAHDAVVLFSRCSIHQFLDMTANLFTKKLVLALSDHYSELALQPEGSLLFNTQSANVQSVVVTVLAV